MKNPPTFDELSPILETQVWALYQTQTRLFFKIGGWQKTPYFFDEEHLARAAYECLGQNDYPHGVIIAFDVSPTHAIVPPGSNAPNIIEPYRAQRQAQTIQQQLPTSTPPKSKSKL